MEYKEFIDFMIKAKKIRDKICSLFEKCEDCPLGISEHYCSVANIYAMPEEKFNMIKNYSEWEDVPVDAKILVWDREIPNIKFNAHFAEYKNGKVYTWAHGKTSFTTFAKEEWNFGELYNED